VVNRLQRSVTRQLNDWRSDQWSATLDPEDQSLWRVTKGVMRIPTPSTRCHLGGIDLADSKKAEALADSM